MEVVDLIRESLEETAGYLNQKIFEILKKLILSNELVDNYRLPSSRQLAKELGVARNTIILVYEQLDIEGYIYTLPGSGTYIKRSMQHQSEGRLFFEARPSLRGAAILENTYTGAITKSIPFTPFAPDVSLFPHRKFNNLIHKIRRNSEVDDLHYTSDGGVYELKTAIANHLSESRNINCEADQILVFHNSNEALRLIANILCDPNDIVLLENPTYWGFRSVFKMLGLQTETVDVDEEGIDIQKYMYNGQVPSLMLVTPSRQYPLGHVMTIERRLGLIEYAKSVGAWIIEDDYDGEFPLSKYSISSLFSLEEAPVIYMGSFSKTIYPAIGVSYLVVPHSLKKMLIPAHGVLYRSADRVMHKALAAFIHQGDYSSHLKSVRSIYSRRRQKLLDLLYYYLGNDFVDLEPHMNTGLHINLKLPDNWDDQKIVKKLADKGVNSSALSRYYAGSPAKKGLLLGFACISEEEMEPPVKILAQVIQDIVKEKFCDTAKLPT